MMLQQHFKATKKVKGVARLDDLSFSSITHHDLIFSMLRANEILDDFELWLLRQTIKNPRISLKTICNNFGNCDKLIEHFGHLKRDSDFLVPDFYYCLKDK